MHGRGFPRLDGGSGRLAAACTCIVLLAAAAVLACACARSAGGGSGVAAVGSDAAESASGASGATQPANFESEGRVMGEYWVVVGDSYSDAGFAAYGEFGVRAWPLLVEERTGVGIRNYASAGDGYVHVHAVTFPQQAQQAAQDASYDHAQVARVIIYGGINDSSSGEDLSAVRAGAEQTARVLAEAFPDARIEGFMNWYPHVFDDGAQAYVDAIAAGLSTAGVPLRTDSMWILENDQVADAYLPDNLHPNQHGHNLMADFFIAS